MKFAYILPTLLTLFSFFGLRAQESDPNRMLVIDPSGSYKSYILGRVDEIRFAKVDGEVACYVDVEDVTLSSLILTTQMTDECKAYSINVVPAVMANKFETPSSAIAYLESINSPQYQDNFYSGQLSGIELSPDTKYTVMTVGYDEYNTACDVQRADFTTPSKPLVGAPTATIEVTDRQLDKITATFTPNNDVAGYAYLIMEHGMLDKMFEYYAPMFGLSNIGDLVKMWGGNEVGHAKKSNTWKDLDPNTDYDLLCQVWDKNGTYAPLVTCETSTLRKGGSGDAFVDIKLGDYKLQDWDGQQLPSQFVTYIPNDQTSRYRFNVLLKENYDKDPKGYQEDLCSDPEMPTAYWFFFDKFETDYQINPNTEFVVLAAAKNADNVWGEVNVVSGKTPEKASKVAPSKEIGKRDVKPVANSFAKVPAYRKVTLSH